MIFFYYNEYFSLFYYNDLVMGGAHLNSIISRLKNFNFRAHFGNTISQICRSIAENCILSLRFLCITSYHARYSRATKLTYSLF